MMLCFAEPVECEMVLHRHLVVDERSDGFDGHVSYQTRDGFIFEGGTTQRTVFCNGAGSWSAVLAVEGVCTLHMYFVDVPSCSIQAAGADLKLLHS